MRTIILIMLVALFVVCSARPSLTNRSDNGEVRVRRQAVLLRGSCPVYKARLLRNCIPCDRFEEITGKNCPGDPKYFRKPVRGQSRH